MPFDSVFPHVPAFLAACAILAFAQAVYVLLGFGSGLIAVGTLALVLPLQDVVVLLLLVSLPVELFVVGRSRAEVSWRGVLPVAIAVGLCVPVGTWALDRGAPTVLLTFLAVFLIAVGAIFLASPQTTVRWPRGAGPLIGGVAGVLGGAFGTSGPPLILYYQLAGIPKGEFRGNLMSIFLLITLVRLPSYGVSGLIGVPDLLSAASVFPAVLLGAWAGNRIHLELPEATFRRLVSGALVVIGLVLLAQRLSTGEG